MIKYLLRAACAATLLLCSILLSAASPPFVFNPARCNKSLFPESDSGGANSIDFCKELVVIDPAIIKGLPERSFNQTMRRMLGTNEQDTQALMKVWADSWKDLRGDAGRADVSEQIMHAWGNDEIKLIAVVNRLDLALTSDADENFGEGRLVYQMFKGDLAQDMTFILEFAYPRLDAHGNRQENLSLWAEKWHELGTQPATATAFMHQLREIVGEFAVSRNLIRIRTNEQLEPNLHWAFREYSFSACNVSNRAAPCSPALEWKSLRDTPQDIFRGPGASTLLAYLRHPKVMEALEKGDHHFDIDYDQDPDTGIETDWAAQTGEMYTWVSPLVETVESRLLMTFNTCNGCHADFKKSHDVLPHIGVHGVGPWPLLSSFLTDPVEMNYRLVGCRATPRWEGCGERGARFTWDEQRHRAYYLFSKLRANAQQLLLQPEPLLQYRYH